MRDWWPRSPAMARAEVWRAAAVGAVLSLVQFFTLLPNIDSHIAADPGDPLPQSWQVAWGGHALLNQPFAFWQANQFWPEKDTLAFSDALVGYSPFGMFGSGPHAALVRYNLRYLAAGARAWRTEHSGNGWRSSVRLFTVAA